MLIQPYKESWVEDFQAIKKILNEALIDVQISIEHVGSTAVPGLASKPIIDIDIMFSNNVAFDDIKIRLERIGYYHNGNQGIPDREVFKRGKTTAKQDVLDFIIHHLYFCPAASEELQRHILFRDYLIADEKARIQYQNLKYDIAKAANQDRKLYAALKEIKARDFINRIIKKAKRTKTSTYDL